MCNNKKLFQQQYMALVFLLSCFRVGFAHQPDLSSLMIYEQDGKSILLIKSSLTAFEGEIDYIYAKDSYKTPQEFQELVIKHFQKNCLVIINKDTIKFVNPYVALGHETTLFAELSNKPGTIKSLYLKNTMFEDIPNNLCEVILTMKNLPQKQFILGNALQHGAQLNVVNGTWIMEDTVHSFYKNSNFIYWGAFLAIGLAIFIIGVIKSNNTAQPLLHSSR